MTWWVVFCIILAASCQSIGWTGGISGSEGFNEAWLFEDAHDLPAEPFLITRVQYTCACFVDTADVCLYASAAQSATPLYCISNVPCHSQPWLNMTDVPLEVSRPPPPRSGPIPAPSGNLTLGISLSVHLGRVSFVGYGPCTDDAFGRYWGIGLAEDITVALPLLPQPFPVCAQPYFRFEYEIPPSFSGTPCAEPLCDEAASRVWFCNGTHLDGTILENCDFGCASGTDHCRSEHELGALCRKSSKCDRDTGTLWMCEPVWNNLTSSVLCEFGCDDGRCLDEFELGSACVGDRLRDRSPEGIDELWLCGANGSFTGFELCFWGWSNATGAYRCLDEFEAGANCTRAKCDLADTLWTCDGGIGVLSGETTDCSVFGCNGAEERCWDEFEIGSGCETRRCEGDTTLWLCDVSSNSLNGSQVECPAFGCVGADHCLTEFEIGATCEGGIDKCGSNHVLWECNDVSGRLTGSSTCENGCYDGDCVIGANKGALCTENMCADDATTLWICHIPEGEVDRILFLSVDCGSDTKCEDGECVADTGLGMSGATRPGEIAGYTSIAIIVVLVFIIAVLVVVVVLMCLRKKDAKRPGGPIEQIPLQDVIAEEERKVKIDGEEEIKEETQSSSSSSQDGDGSN